MKHARPDYDRIQDPANKIPADEPVFLLRGQDLFAPATLRAYADMLRRRGELGEDLTEEVRDGLKEMAVTVEAHADLMDVWQTKEKAKWPDVAK